MHSRLSQYAAPVLLCALMVVILFCVFWPALFSTETLFSADQSPTTLIQDYQAKLRAAFTGDWVPDSLGVGSGGRAVHPTKLLGILFPPMWYHVGTYLFDALLLFCAFMFCMRDKQRSWVVSGLPALSIAFSGYAFSLISAGHRGQFHMMPYAVFLLGCIDRGMARRSPFYFGMAGLCVGFGMAGQPDVMLLFCILAGSYAIFRLIAEWRALPVGRYPLIVACAKGVILAAVIVAALSVSVFGSLFKTTLPHRESLRGETKEQQWEYCTNWSLPPEEILEFVAPCIYGIETQDEDGPYWGRLGRAMNWGKTKQGLINLRQHTVYMGVLQLVFAVFAVAVAVRTRRFRAGTLDDDGVPSVGTEMGTSRADVFFWAGAFLLTVLLALGRYFPLYRLVFMVPYLNKIRCPVKWLHLSEVALAFLFAFGLSAFFKMLRERVVSKPEKRSKRTVHTDSQKMTFLWSAGVCIVMAVLLFSGTGVAGVCKGSLGCYWGSLGFEKQSALLMRVMIGSLRHGAFLFLIGSGVFAVAAWQGRKKWCAPLLKGVLFVVVCSDLTIVAKRYINTRDVRVFHDNNVIAERILADEEMGRVSDQLTTRGKFDPRWTSLRNNGVDFLEPMQREVPLPSEYGEFFGALQANPLRLWQITNTRYVLGPMSKLENLLKHPSFEAVEYFDVIGGRLISSVKGRAQNVLVKFSGALPRALVYHDWQQIDADNALALLGTSTWHPEKTVLVTGGISASAQGLPPSPARVVKYGYTKVVVEVDNDSPGVLLLNDKYDPDWRVRVDGVRGSVLCCNSIMRGVEVPAGKHTVVFTYRPFLIPFLLSIGTSLFMLLWWLFRVIKHIRSARSAS